MEAVLLNSGGPDTLASVLKLKEADEKLILHSLFIDLGQSNLTRASKAASLIASKYCVSQEEYGFKQDMTVINFSKPEARRVMCYLSIFIHILGAIRARQLNVKYIVAGTDSYQVEGFAGKFASLLAEDPWAPYPVVPIHPVKDFTKEERLLYIKDNVLANYTVSCNEVAACGICNKCTSRLSLGLFAN